MNKHNAAKRPGLQLGFLLLFCALLLAGCGGNNNQVAEGEPPVEGALQPNEVQFVCSDSCAERAQCGTTLEQVPVVLGRTDFPDLSGQNAVVPAGTIGTVVETRGEQVLEVATNAQFTATFFRVSVPELGADVWVPEWCISQ